MEPHSQLSLRSKAAYCIKKILSGVITPVTGFLQRVDLAKYSKNDLSSRGGFRRYIHRVICFFVRGFSWFCQGIITLAYPTMGYHPIAARRQAIAWQWASQLLKVPNADLEPIAHKFLLEVQETPAQQPTNLESLPTFTVLICFHHHLNFFKSCLDSIKAACHHAPDASVEILIINDDPSIDSELLLKEASTFLRDKITLHANEHNLGICRSANQAIERARGEWILHLDCDDRLAPEVFQVLEQTLKKNPRVRYISSRAVDIDEQGKILSWRLRSEEPKDLIKNNVASHLKVIKKDLHKDLGFFNTIFEGCQDYEFALRVAVNEPLCFIPDYLYQYRWHNQSQTVSNNNRQNLTAARIRQTYLLAIYWMTQGTKNIQWDITGPYADSWQSNVMPSENGFQYQVALEALSPYNKHQWKGLLIQIATIVVDRYRTQDHNREITMSTNKC